MKVLRLQWFLPLFFVLPFFCGCSEDEIQLDQIGDDYLIFGEHDSECFGEACTRIFALTREKLYQDNNRSLDFSNSSFKALNDESESMVVGELKEERMKVKNLQK